MAHWRQALHLEPPQGWLNDPNGLCFFGGQYHVFFQYAPLGAEGSGPKGWGHWQSADLLHWTFAGMPLRPDTPWDQSGAYSGCAVPCGDTLRLYYTGNVKHPGPYDYIHEGRESNTLLVETPDGLRMGPKERLMESKDYPADCSLHVRDPKVWREDGLWKMLLGARSLADAGRALLYHSNDGRAWTLARVLELFGNEETGCRLCTSTGQRGDVLLGEDLEDPIPGLSVIRKRYLAGGGLMGGLAIVGPARMPFQKLMPGLDYFALKLGQSMAGNLQEDAT